MQGAFHWAQRAGNIPTEEYVLATVQVQWCKETVAGVQVGYQTWYPNADPSYIQRCRVKDEQTTQAAFGFKICGMQVCLPSHSSSPCCCCHTGPAPWAVVSRTSVDGLTVKTPCDANLQLHQCWQRGDILEVHLKTVWASARTRKRFQAFCVLLCSGADGACSCPDAGWHSTCRRRRKLLAGCG